MKKRQDARLVAMVLSGSWRQSAESLEISDSELAEIAALLIQAGAGALVWRRIRDSALATSDAAAQLHQAYRLHRLEGTLHIRRLKRVAQQLRAAGIEPVLVKGWNVARLYPEPGLRHYFDVDLCVAHVHYAAASNLVADMDGDSPYVDLHDELDHLDVMRWDDFFARSQVLKLDDTEVRVPCAEDHLRILCIHWLRHGAWKPAGLCDIAAQLESRSSDFDWQRCLGPDPVRAGWVACTIGLAQQLLAAGSADVPSALSAQRELPRWLVPAVLRQWSRSLSPMYREPALPAFLDRLTRWRELTMDLYSRLDQPVRATIAMRGGFNNWPRLPYQLGELLLHSSEAPKQLAAMLGERVSNRKERATEAQRHREGNGTGRNETTDEAWRALPFVP